MADLVSFKSSFRGDLILPEDAGYPKAIARWSVTAEKKAAIVAFVKGEDDVALAIKYAKSNKLPIAIRGGGHNPGGTSSVEDGLVVDLSRYLNGARVDPEKKLAYVGGGALWETVDKEAIKHGLATVGGTVNHTGVGGLTLGGGFGWLTGSYGLVIDNLIQVTIVTASGAIVTANDATNPELYWGVKGGGCNFGVVTEFILKLHPQRATVYAGPLIFVPPQTDKLVEATAEWYKNAGEKEGMLQIVSVAPDGNPAIVVFPFYNGSVEEGRTAFKAFLDIGKLQSLPWRQVVLDALYTGPVADHSGEVPYEVLNSLQNEQANHGQGFYLKGVAPRLPGYGNMAATHRRVVDIIKSPESGGLQPAVIFEWFPLHKVNSVPSDATAFRRNVTPSVLTVIAWPGEGNKELVNGKTKVELARQFAHEVSEIVTQGQSEFSPGYTNYDSDAEIGVDKAKIAFEENYPRLQRLKKDWDPENVFNKWFPITPA